MINKITFKENSFNENYSKKEYKDPLMKWPLRGAAFTNEIGEGLRPIIGSTANLFWIPVFLYIGADVYDKYKNDGNAYNPSNSRSAKQACFQGLASIVLPLLAIKTGQKAFSLFGLLSQEKLTFNKQNQIIDLAKTFVANGNMRAYNNKDKECIDKFKDIVNNHLDFKKNKNLLMKLLGNFEELLKINTTKNSQNFAETIINELISTRKALLEPNENFKQNPLFLKFQSAIKNGETKSVATKSVLTKMLENNTLKSRMITTVGGFLAIGCLIKPIDKFVEHIIINKFIGPKIDKIEDYKIKR